MAHITPVLIALLALAGRPPAADADTLHAPKAVSLADGRAGAEDGGAGAKPHECCEFLCKVYLLNCTGTKVKVWVRATLLCWPRVRVDIPAECLGKLLVACPCDHPWSIWFDQVRIGVWDGETSQTIRVPFKGCCCKRRFVIEYDQDHHIRIFER